jgi:multidrug resistance efflux pump
MVAMFEADHKKLERTQQLVEIGAASRQELEEVTAVHEGHTTEVESARQRLLLLGLQPEQVQALGSASQVVSTVVVPAPIDGVITGRTVNLGQVVSMGQELNSWSSPISPTSGWSRISTSRTSRRWGWARKRRSPRRRTRA